MSKAKRAALFRYLDQDQLAELTEIERRLADSDRQRAPWLRRRRRLMNLVAVHVYREKLRRAA